MVCSSSQHPHFLPGRCPLLCEPCPHVIVLGCLALPVHQTRGPNGLPPFTAHWPSESLPGPLSSRRAVRPPPPWATQLRRRPRDLSLLYKPRCLGRFVPRAPPQPLLGQGCSSPRVAKFAGQQALKPTSVFQKGACSQTGNRAERSAELLSRREVRAAVGNNRSAIAPLSGLEEGPARCERGGAQNSRPCRGDRMREVQGI